MNNRFLEDKYAALYQRHRHQHLRIDLLNSKDNIIDSFTGIAISGTVNLNATSTYRRTANLSLKLHNKLIPEENGSIWFNRKIKLSVGLQYGNDIIWYSLGHYVIKSANLDIGHGTQKLSMELLDYMALIDGTLFGNISHQTELKVESGVKVNDAIASTVDHLPKIAIDRFDIDGLDMVLPYDMEFSPGSTTYDIVKQLVELYMSQEFYFDKNGVFRVARIRNKINDPVAWDFTQDNMDISISYGRKLDFSNVKNAIWVWGKTLKTGKQHYWCYRNEYKRNSFSELKDIKDMQIGSLCYVVNEGQTYGYDGSKWDKVDINIVPRFNIESIGEKIHSISDDTIMDDKQAKLKAEYELENTSHFAETINITTVPIYILEPNMKIRVEESSIKSEGDFLIKSISIGLGANSTMSISAEKIYY